MSDRSEKNRVETHDLKIEMSQSKKSSKKILFFCLFVVTLVLIFMPFWLNHWNSQKENTEIITISTLERIINVSELTTFQAVYNGVAEVMNEENHDEIDYYVSYEAKVYAGFDLERVGIDLDSESKIITVLIPEIIITDINVDIASLDFIFQNEKANTSTVSAQAYRASIEAVTRETKQVSEIYDLAAQNAKNVMTALINPFINQMDPMFELRVIIGRAQ